MNKQRYDQSSLSVPAVVDSISTTPHREEPYYELRNETHDNSGQVVVTVAHLLVAVIILVFLFVNQGNALVSLLGMVAYFVIAFFGSQFIQSGTMRAWIRESYWFRLEKYRIDTQYELAQEQIELMKLEARRQLPAPPMQGVHQESASNYVPAYRPEDISRAIAYARSLYSSDGYLSTKAVMPSGKIRGTVIGSARSEGNKEDARARDYLIDHRFLIERKGGTWVGEEYPTIAELARLRVKTPAIVEG